VEDFLAKDFKSMATEKFGTAFAEKGSVGCPNAQEPSIGVEFKKEFVKGFNERDEGMKRIATSAAKFPLRDRGARIGKVFFGERYGQRIGIVLSLTRGTARAPLRRF
jgi:hypothetical protein